MAKKYILSIDTALSECSVGICTGAGEPVYQERKSMPRGQAEALMPMIQRGLDEAKVAYVDIQKIAVTRGPGAFTGVRIGLATARALGLALDVPVIGMATTDILAASFFQSKPAGIAENGSLLVLLETKRKDFYYQFFDLASGKMTTKPAAASHEHIMESCSGDDKPVIVIGDAWERFKALCTDEGRLEYIAEYDLPDPIVLAQISAQKDNDKYPATPLYLRGADVSQPKHVQRQLETK